VQFTANTGLTLPLMILANSIYSALITAMPLFTCVIFPEVIWSNVGLIKCFGRKLTLLCMLDCCRLAPVARMRSQYIASQIELAGTTPADRKFFSDVIKATGCTLAGFALFLASKITFLQCGFLIRRKLPFDDSLKYRCSPTCRRRRRNGDCSTARTWANSRKLQ
jgi:hypothetical protein